VRIVAGRWGGRRLTTPRGAAVRPTADRVREALFSILGGKVDGARVLDLFAGSGALGLEALSRGAAEVTFVDSAAASVAAVRANLEAVGGEAEVRRADALRFLRTAAGETRHYDLVLLDPPYRLASASGASCRRRCQECWRPPRSSSRERPPGAAGARPPLEDERRYGDTLIRIHGSR
jgi:16S rRNA (guanine(966)-N(2))-methyltransferase RsmD